MSFVTSLFLKMLQKKQRWELLGELPINPSIHCFYQSRPSAPAESFSKSTSSHAWRFPVSPKQKSSYWNVVPEHRLLGRCWEQRAKVPRFSEQMLENCVVNCQKLAEVAVFLCQFFTNAQIVKWNLQINYACQISLMVPVFPPKKKKQTRLHNTFGFKNNPHLDLFSHSL